MIIFSGVSLYKFAFAAFIINRPLNRKYQEALKTVFLQTSGTATGSGRRKIHAELSEKITSQWTNIYLFSKSFSHFSGSHVLIVFLYLLFHNEL